jgi:hypothetical protein
LWTINTASKIERNFWREVEGLANALFYYGQNRVGSYKEEEEKKIIEE